MTPPGHWHAFDDPAGFVLERGGSGLWCRGVRHELKLDTDDPDAGRRIIDGLRAHGREALAAGVVGFDPAVPALLRVPTTAERVSVPVCAPEGGSAGPAPVATAARPDSIAQPAATRDAYIASVAEAVARIGRGELEKIVLACAIDVGGPLPHPSELFRRLRRDPGVWCFAGRDAAGALLIGATPELLMRRRGRIAEVRPLAGSASRAESPDGRDLLDSAKNRHEHELAVAGVVESLAPMCEQIDADAQPHLVSTATMWHLETVVRAVLKDPAEDALSLALRLHPTPAVCGTPRDAALDAIRELEQSPRGGYAGPVGWVDASGDGEWVLALRCAELTDERARLFAGSGIVVGSDPQAEWDETRAKLDTMLSALGLA